MNILYILIPTVTTFCAWATSRLMVWGIFNPVTPQKIGGITIHGMVPRLQQHPGKVAGPLANAISNAIAQQSQTVNTDAIRPFIEQHLDTYLSVRLKEKLPVIASFIGPSTTVKLKESMIEEIDTLLPQVINSYVQTEWDRTKIEEKITAAIQEAPTHKLQKMGTGYIQQHRQIMVVPIFIGLLLGLVTDILCYVLIH